MSKHITILFTIFAIVFTAGCSSKSGWLHQNGQQQVIFTQSPQKVALLLPLSGRLKSSGRAIRNGFLAAYYYDKQLKDNVPTVSIYNTNNQDIETVYRKAIQQGAQVIVGPLTKNNVQTLANNNSLPVPTIALNTLDNYQRDNAKNLFQFGLSPLDEAQQLAFKMSGAGIKRVILIAPSGNWGQNIANAFKQQWKQLDGKIVGEFDYPAHDNDLSGPIQGLLDINQSEKRARELEKILHEDFRFVPRRRKDADAIALIALPQQARIIRPMLKYYYAGNIPVYSISLLYSGRNSRNNRDLRGIIFCTMPWMLLNPEDLSSKLLTIRQRILKLWPSSFHRHPKLYALGIDAYDLIGSLNQLSLSPQNNISGATGELYLTPSGHIYRHLLWSKL